MLFNNTGAAQLSSSRLYIPQDNTWFQDKKPNKTITFQIVSKNIYLRRTSCYALLKGLAAQHKLKRHISKLETYQSKPSQFYYNLIHR